MSRRQRAEDYQRAIYSGVAGVLRRCVDGAVGIIAPGTALEMRKNRLRASALLSYEAARHGPQRSNSASGSADAEILGDLQKLRDNSRTMVRDDAHAAAAVRVLEDNVVGEGLRPQSTCTPEATGLTEDQCEDWRNACEAAWNEWADEQADATEYGTFYDLQRIVVRSLMADGEGIGHAVVDGNDIWCELLDPDRLESPNFVDTDKIRGGVQLGDRGQPTHYHILPNHPADVAFGGRGAANPVAVAAADNSYSLVQHVFRRDRPGQTRGVPWLAAALPYNHHLHHYLNSELVAARTNSNVAMFVKRAPNPLDADITLGDDGEAKQFLQTLRPGTIEYLEEGEEIQPFTPNRPGSQFEPFVMRILRAIWASQGLAYELVAKDFGGMNYSSARSMLLECRRGFNAVRKLVIRKFCLPWWGNVLRSRIASGTLVAPRGFIDNPGAFLAARWVAPSYGWVDPVKEIEASRASVEANLSTPYDEAARAGLDAEDIVRERARFAAFVREQEELHDLPPGSLSGAKQAAPSPAAPGAPVKPPPAEEEDEPQEPTEPADDKVDDDEDAPQ